MRETNGRQKRGEKLICFRQPQTFVQNRKNHFYCDFLLKNLCSIENAALLICSSSALKVYLRKHFRILLKGAARPGKKQIRGESDRGGTRNAKRNPKCQPRI